MSLLLSLGDFFFVLQDNDASLRQTTPGHNHDNKTDMPEQCPFKWRDQCETQSLVWIQSKI